MTTSQPALVSYGTLKLVVSCSAQHQQDRSSPLPTPHRLAANQPKPERLETNILSSLDWTIRTNVECRMLLCYVEWYALRLLQPASRRPAAALDNDR